MNVIDVDHFYERLDAIDAALREFSRHYPNVTADQPLPFPRAPEALNVDDFCQKYVPSSSDGIVEIEKMPKQKRKQVSDQSPTIQGSQTNSKKRRRSKQLDGLLGRRRNESERKVYSILIP